MLQHISVSVHTLRESKNIGIQKIICSAHNLNRFEWQKMKFQQFYLNYGFDSTKPRAVSPSLFQSQSDQM